MMYDPTNEKLNKEIAKATDRVYWRGSFYNSFAEAERAMKEYFSSPMNPEAFDYEISKTVTNIKTNLQIYFFDNKQDDFITNREMCDILEKVFLRTVSEFMKASQEFKECKSQKEIARKIMDKDKEVLERLATEDSLNDQ